MSTNDEQKAAHDAAREYAWEWFKFHAAQRMTVFNFFLIITAALTTGFLTSFAGGNYLISTALSAMGLMIAASFFQLDRRNRQLIQISERYLRFEERRLANIVGENSIKFIDESENKPMKVFYTFRQVMKTIFIFFGAIALLELGLSLHKLTSASPSP